VPIPEVVDGRTLADALALTRKETGRHSLLARVIDETLSKPERLAAIHELLDKHAPEAWKVNNVTAGQLTQCIPPDTATRLFSKGECQELDRQYIGPGHDRGPVARPPRKYDDVFRRREGATAPSMTERYPVISVWRKDTETAANMTAQFETTT
jgi:hypothetical protein